MRRRWVAVLFAVTLASCGFEKPVPPVNAAPPDSSAIVVLDLGMLRAEPVYDRLPAAIRAMTEPLGGVRQLAFAWNGRDLLLLAGGFKQVPAGYVAIGKGIAASGAPERIEAARQALAGGSPPPLILPQGTAQVHAAIRGDGKLPFPGNLSNAANLLSMALNSKLTAHLGTDVDLEVEAQCASASQALHLEQSLRAVLTLAAAGTKDPQLAQMLRGVRLTRENILVRVRLMANLAALTKALGVE